mmetsp:Transcript_4466/g.10384  ORF Transcript_4466/g.10384 Transcript_4466/m.10384 type:complete len:369 (+) Transcript_4466:412-1518(+)
MAGPSAAAQRGAPLLGDDDARHAAELLVGELLADGLQGALLGLLQDAADLLRHRLHLRLLVPRGGLEQPRPGRRGLENTIGQVQHRTCNQRRPVTNHRVVGQSQLHQELGCMRVQLQTSRQLHVSHQEEVRRGHRHLEPQTVQNGDLHRRDIRSLVSQVRNVHQIINLGRIDLFKLSGDQQASDANQLQPGAGHAARHAEVPVDQLHGGEEGAGRQLELAVDFHQPVHQDGPHLAGQTGLAVLHVLGVGHQRHLLRLQLAHDLRGVLRRCLGILEIGLIDVGQLTGRCGHPRPGTVRCLHRDGCRLVTGHPRLRRYEKLLRRGVRLRRRRWRRHRRSDIGEPAGACGPRRQRVQPSQGLRSAPEGISG